MRSDSYLVEDVVEGSLGLAQRIGYLLRTEPGFLFLDPADVVRVLLVDNQGESLFSEFTVFLLDGPHGLHVLQQQLHLLLLGHVHIVIEELFALGALEFAYADVAGKDDRLREPGQGEVLSEFGEGGSGVKRGREQSQMVVLSLIVDLEVNEVELGCAD